MSRLIEIFKDIKGYEGLYQVSNFGRIKSLHYKRTQQEGFLSLTPSKSGYVRVALQQYKLCAVHRLVAQAFLPNPNNYPCIDHKDCNRTNNFVWVNEDGTVDEEKSNLRWCTPKQNMENPITKQRQKESTKGSHLCAHRGKFGSEHPVSKTVYQYSKDKTVLIGKYGSTLEAERKTGVCRTCIGDCCNKKQKTAGGYYWSY